MKLFTKLIQFQWDKGNLDKNFHKHGITNTECEEIFFDDKRKISKDIFHSNKEPRYILLGQTKVKRLLYTVFTIRNNKIRIISSRDINKKERKLYEKTI
ncbi:BrnT family toxin [Patescibacteria group bacterium]|nr:BrnT family toxin [Patescibacteria group bacterium]MBU4511689.1 BrnT family toxin [Patescibacteria group bacterium]MCG2692750.1 BrnT family toxin [Candidatus Parcubacteria bacterium]